MLALLLALAALPSAQAWAEAGFCGPSARQCTRIELPLDRSGAVPGTVALEVQRARAKAPSAAPVFLLAGGPGQSATRAYERAAISKLLGREARRRDVVVIDQRGTGSSGALNCPALQGVGSLGLADAAAQCAALLGPARPFFTTADSVADLEAVRIALGYDRIALLAVSYGTVVAEQYARAHPDHVDALVLDSPVPVAGIDPLYRASFAAIPRVLRELCRRHRCAGVTRDPAADLARLAGRLRAAPLRGRFVTSTGRRVRARLTGQDLFSALVAGDLRPSLRWRVPGAVRSALRGDGAPVIRLAQLAQDAPAIPARELSAGAFAATICEETPLPWEPATPLDQRPAQARARVQALPAAAFAPFDADTALASDVLDLCARWPGAERPPLADGALPDVPTLILSGTQDLRTPNESAHRLASGLPHATVLDAAGVGHSVIGSEWTDCAERATRRLLAGGRVPRSCAFGAPLEVAPIAPTSLRRLAPRRGPRGRTLAAVRSTYQDSLQLLLGFVLETAGADDPISYAGGGLRGGDFDFEGDHVTLDDLVYVPGVEVSGRLNSVAIFPGGTLRVGGRSAVHGTLHVRRGVMRGRLAGKRVHARLGPDLFDLTFALALSPLTDLVTALAASPARAG